METKAKEAALGLLKTATDKLTPEGINLLVRFKEAMKQLVNGNGNRDQAIKEFFFAVRDAYVLGNLPEETFWLIPWIPGNFDRIKQTAIAFRKGHLLLGEQVPTKGICFQTALGIIKKLRARLGKENQKEKKNTLFISDLEGCIRPLQQYLDSQSNKHRKPPSSGDFSLGKTLEAEPQTAAAVTS